MVPMEFDPNNLQKLKLACHITQVVFIVFIFVLEIIVFSKSVAIDGRVGWQFGLCFLTIPAIIYLTMTLRFPRTRKLAQPYALATVDFLFAFLWISGFSSQASFNSAGKCRGACGVSKAVVGLGVMTWVLWVITTIFSLYGVMYWKREGYLPGASRVPYNAAAIDPDKEAFSTAPHDDEYVAVHNADEHEILDYTSSTNSLGNRYDGGYHGVGRVGGYAPPQVSSHEDTAYTGAAGATESMSERVRFPDARYENI